MAAVFQAFFDESIESDQGTFCVAGYAFTKLNLRKFERGWVALLARHKLPHFRMSSCAHGHGAFQGMPKDERILVQTEAIGLISKYAAFGVAATIDQTDFGENWHVEVVKTAYECCALAAVIGVRSWAETNRPGVRFGFFFEEGHAHQRRAFRMLQHLFTDAKGAEKYGNPSWGFVSKDESPAAQAADMLAWLWMGDMRRRRDNTRPTPRADLKALVAGTPHETLAIDMTRWNEATQARMRDRVGVTDNT